MQYQLVRRHRRMMTARDGRVERLTKAPPFEGGRGGVTLNPKKAALWVVWGGNASQRARLVSDPRQQP